MIFKSLLNDINDVISVYQNIMVKINYEEDVRAKYYSIKYKNMLSSLFHFLRKEFGNDSEMYIFLLSVIQRCTNDKESLQEIIEFLLFAKVEFMDSICYRKQIEWYIFTNINIDSYYELRRKLHKVQLVQLEETYSCDYDYIPYLDRNENRVVIITNQLLSGSHAPTRNVLEVCSALQAIGKEVLLIVVIEMNKNLAIKYQEKWYRPVAENYDDSLIGKFKISYYNSEIFGMQFILTEKDGKNVFDVITFIYKYNPQFLWYMGGTSLFPDLFRKVTTLVSMPFSDGHIISEAPILVEYMNSGSKEVKEMEKYIEEQKQTILHFDFEQPIHPSPYIYHRQNFGLKKDSFLITIVGNRLNYEISNELIRVLNDILALSDKIHIVFIGEMEKLNGLLKEEQISYLGHQQDLIGILGMFDLFINPPRKGGGTGAYWALYNGIPVISLDNCDVANCVTEEFICNDINDMTTIVSKYYHDKTYYKEMKIKAKDIINKIEEENNLSQNIKSLISKIRDETIKREKSGVI